jgi:LEA14-like dessication related protein
MKKFFSLFYTKIAVFVAALCAIVTFSNCQTVMSALQEPLISLHSVELASVNFTGMQLLCKVQVENPNAFDIPFPETGWEFFINTHSFISGVVKNNQRIRAKRTTLVDVPVNLNYLEIFNVFTSLKGGRQADYKVALAVKFSIPVIGDKVWQFEHEGTIPIPQLPRLSMPSMSIGTVDFTKAEILVTVNVENPNAFELPPFTIAYDYLVNRNSFINSSIETAAPLAAAAVTPVIIRLSVNYADLFRNFQSLLNSGEVPSLISLTGNFGIPAFSGENFNMQIPSSLPLLKIPTIRFGGIRIRNLSLSNIEFEINWEVENNNNFAMNVKDLNYSLTVNNSTWTSGRAANAPQISANRRTTIPIVFSINALAMVREITEIITRGTDVAYVCNGNINLGMALQGLSDLNNPFNFSGTTRLSR